MLNDFASIFAFAATLNIAFVAVTYTSSYTNMLANHVFRFANEVKTYFDNKRKSILLDLNSLKAMPDVPVGENGSTVWQKQDYIRKGEKLITKITAEETELNLKIAERCSSRKFSLFSLIMFFYCITFLFFGALKIDECAACILYIFTIGILIGCILMFFEKKESLLWPIIIFPTSLLFAFLSLGCSYLINLFNIINNLSLFIFSFVPFIFFIIYFFTTFYQRNAIKKEMDKTFNNVDKEFKELDEGTTFLNKVQNLSVENNKKENS